jgi:hypothetical protein
LQTSHVIVKVGRGHQSGPPPNFGGELSDFFLPFKNLHLPIAEITAVISKRLVNRSS